MMATDCAPVLRRRNLVLAALMPAWLNPLQWAGAQEPDGVARLAQWYAEEVDWRLSPSDDACRAYANLVTDALAQAQRLPLPAQFMAVVDRCPQVQALLLLWRDALGAVRLVGASPVSTGRPGSFDHFETPVGVFVHGLANPDFRAEGTRNSRGVRGYGSRGMRVFDLGWQRAAKGWGDRAVSSMRLQMHATDPQLLEPRLGTVQSKGCIRIPGTLNRFFDHHGVLDAEYEAAALAGRTNWVLDPGRTVVEGAGNLVVVVDSHHVQRPDWATVPQIRKHIGVQRVGRLTS